MTMTMDNVTQKMIGHTGVLESEDPPSPAVIKLMEGIFAEVGTLAEAADAEQRCEPLGLSGGGVVETSLEADEVGDNVG